MLSNCNECIRYHWLWVVYIKRVILLSDWHLRFCSSWRYILLLNNFTQQCMLRLDLSIAATFLLFSSLINAARVTIILFSCLNTCFAERIWQSFSLEEKGSRLRNHNTSVWIWPDTKTWTFYWTRRMIYWAYIDTLCKKHQVPKKNWRRWHCVRKPTFHTAIWNYTMKMMEHFKRMIPVALMASLDSRETTTMNSIQVSRRLIWRNCCGMNTTTGREHSGTITLFPWGWS